MKKFTLLLSAVLLACATNLWAATTETLAINFENEVSAYTDWTLTNIPTQQKDSKVTAPEGSYFGITNGTETASAQTKEVVAKPVSISFSVSKLTTNDKASSWIIQVSSDAKTWTDVKTVSASSMERGTWVDVSQDLSSYSNVYVRVYYTGSTAKRTIDNIVLTYKSATTAPLTAITISIPENVQLKKEYIVRTGFDVTGIKAVATYEGVSEGEDVTEDVTWTIDPETFESVEENASVMVQASIGEMKSNKLEITGITVRNLYNYTITWLDKNETFKTTTVTEGDALVLPVTNPTCETKEFVGWTASETIPENATIEEMAFVNETTIPVADATYRAVFAKSQLVGAAEWQLVTTADDLKVGTKLLIASTSKGAVAGAITTGSSSSYMGKVAATFANNVCTPTDAGAVELTLGGTSAAWTLTNAEGQLLGATALKKVAWGSGTTTWTISIDKDNNATIQNTTKDYGRFLYNVKDTRFTTYTSDANSSMLLPQLYKWGQSQSYSEFSFTCPSTPSDIESISVPATSVLKTIENGQLIILRDGVKYNAMGVRLQ